MEEYFSGRKLYGDDFSAEQIKQWYDAEAEGYAGLGAGQHNKYQYHYHTLNQVHGFSKIKEASLGNALGFGAAWGDEFLPIADRITNLTLIEPSDIMVSERIGHLTPHYVKPAVDGTLPFGDDQFDLVTCFGTLHHIPNVSHVTRELIRVLKPGGHLLLREPVVSMGDWRVKRRGLTANERGIPVSHFDAIFAAAPVEVVSKEYCFTAPSVFVRITRNILKKPIYAYRWYVLFDKAISAMLKHNFHYHPHNHLQKITPGSIFYVLKRNA